MKEADKGNWVVLMNKLHYKKPNFIIINVIEQEKDYWTRKKLIKLCYSNLDSLGKFSRKNNDSTTLVTFDVKILYASIPDNYGLESITFWLEQHPGPLHSRFSKRFESIKITLKK